MKFIVKLSQLLKKSLPSPFSIAVILTYLTIILALWLTPAAPTSQSHLLEIGSYWAKGFWELLTFSMQMMLILVLGYVLALTRPAKILIEKMVTYADSMPRAAIMVTFLTILFCLINWGLGLIFGAVLARKIGESASRRKIAINYPLIGAAGYSGLMVWHGGLSGSAPLKVAESGHFLMDKIGVIPISETLFSTMNISIALALLVLLPLLMGWTARKTAHANLLTRISSETAETSPENKAEIHGAERLDHSPVFSGILGISFLATSIYLAIRAGNWSFVTLNYINFCLFTLAILLSKNIAEFLKLVQQSIGAASGILIQFPLYAGIMGIMKYSGLFLVFTDFFVRLSSAASLPVFTLLSAGLVNFFVPSGGGQWAVQGPVIVEAAKQLGVSIPKIVMALAYGDQWTNMLQPFWALPLLGITGLKAKEIVPYTFVLFLAGGLIFVVGLLVF